MEDTMLRRLLQTSPARVVAGFSIALVAAACGESPTEQTWMEPALAVVQGFGADPTAACSPISSFLLIADNGGLEVGSVRVANNESNLFVTFETDEWQVTETHLFVGTAVSDIPTARGGNPLPGKFPYMNQHGTGTTSYTYAVPLSELGGAESIIVAAHADIALGELEEGAWGEGDMIVPDKSWGMYFAYQIVDCASGLIGIEGGVLESEGVTVTIPEGALDASEEISFHSVDASSLPEGAIEGTAYDFRPDGLVFNDPGVEIVVEYDDTGMTVAEEEALALFLLNDGVWERVEDSAVNPLENTITAWVTHFSVYAVVPAVAELSLSVTPQPVQEQEQLTHDVSIENLSGSQLTGLEVRVLAKGLVNTPQAPSYCSALGIDSGPDAPALLFICTLDVATGATEDFQVSLRPQAGAQGTVIESHAEFDYGTQTASSPIVTTTVEAPTGGADLSVSIVDTPDPVTAGSTLSYDLMVANAGPDGVTDVTVGFKIYHASLLPSPITFSTGCSLFGKTADHYLVLCELASLPASGDHTFTIDLEPTDLGTLTSEASIDSWTGPADPNLADNEDTEETTVEAPTGGADLSVSIVDTPDPVTAGSTLSYDLMVANAGPDGVTDVTVGFKIYHASLLPSPITFSTGCSLFGKTADHYLVLCELASLPASSNHTFTIDLEPTDLGTLTSEASIDSWTGPADPNLADNEDTEETTVEAPTGGADLSISIVDTPDPVTAGSTLSYDLMVANAGPDGVTDVTVGFKIYHASLLPSPMTFSTGCSLFGKAADHYLVLCQLASLPSSSNHTFTIDLEPTDLGTLTSEASIDSWTGPADPNLADNEDTEDTEVVSATGLDGHVLFTSNRDGSNDVYVKNLASGAVTRLTAGENAITAEWSPDGTKVAYASQPATGNDYDIRVLTIATMQIETVATGFRAHNPTWSPDGTRLAYTSNDGVTLDWDIHVVDLNTLSDVVVADSDETDREPAWSPDGTRIAFQRDYGFGVFEVLSVDLASDVTSLLYAGTIEDLAWSPDGSKIAGRQWKNQTPVYEIVVLDLGTNVLSTITTEESIATDPIWSPSGGQLVFSLRDPTTGTYDIHVVGATGGSISLVESSPANDFSAGWRLAY
jgi:hypothetical protein